ncbi:MAG: 3'-5' exonuclease [Candidatus Corynebacterium faecigallinarum]
MGFLSSLLNEVMSPGRPVFAVVDTETTGFSAKRDRIIELGVVLIDSNFRECERWSTLINPQKKITNSHIHGITDDMVANAPTFSSDPPATADWHDGSSPGSATAMSTCSPAPAPCSPRAAPGPTGQCRRP